MKSCRVIYLCLLTALLMFNAWQPALAHPARSVEVSAGLDGRVSVTIDHRVNDTAKHYIYKIAIYADNALVAQKEYQSQPSPERFTETFDVGPLSQGASVRAEAHCVIMGAAIGSTAAGN